MLGSLMRNKQIIKVAEFTILEDLILFKSFDGIDESRPLIFYPLNEIKSDIEITLYVDGDDDGVNYLIKPSDPFILISGDINVIKIDTVKFTEFEVGDELVETLLKGNSYDKFEFYTLNKNTAKLLYQHNNSLSKIQKISHDINQSFNLDNAYGDWLDKFGSSYQIGRNAEDDDTFRRRIYNTIHNSDGSIGDSIINIATYLNVSPSDIIITEYNQDLWVLGESALYYNKDSKVRSSELIINDDKLIIRHMQFRLQISNYNGSLSEVDIEKYLKTVISIGSVPIVRLI